MSSKEPQLLANATAEQAREWLMHGILGMSGLYDGGKHAFEPYAGHIGRAREFTWLDELSKFALNLENPAKARFDQALNETLQVLSREDLSTNWVALLHLLDLMRSTNTQHRFKGLECLAARLDQHDNGTDAELSRRIAATAFLAATDAEGGDRLLVRSVAVKLARLVLALNTRDDTPLRDGIHTRLQRVRVPNTEIEALGLSKHDSQPFNRTELQDLFTGSHNSAHNI